MIMRVGWLRLVLEIAFILGVAAVTWALEVNKVWIVVLVLLAWVLTALLERAAAGQADARREEQPVAPPPPVDGDADPVAAALEAPPRRPDVFSRLVAALSGSRTAQDAARADPAREERAQEVDAGVEERPCATCGRPIPLERLLAVPDATQCLDCKRAGRTIPVEEEDEPQQEPPPPESDLGELLQPVAVQAEPAPAREPEPVAVAEPVAAAPAPPPPLPEPIPPRFSGWNVWELERLARERAGRDVARDEEWGFLLVYLREFADPDGFLPPDFDGLVRESFADLIG